MDMDPHMDYFVTTVLGPPGLKFSIRFFWNKAHIFSVETINRTRSPKLLSVGIGKTPCGASSCQIPERGTENDEISRKIWVWHAYRAFYFFTNLWYVWKGLSIWGSDSMHLCIAIELLSMTYYVDLQSTTKRQEYTRQAADFLTCVKSAGQLEILIPSQANI